MSGPKPKKARKSSDNAGNHSHSDEFFPGIGKIQYNGHAGPDDVLCFKHYNATEVIHGRTMEDWLRFSVCYWHTFRGSGADPFGFPTIQRPWDDGRKS
ncbi:uncharacterized protein [Ptychodera flava]|uniref:uncharacterized protein n=1 Tax=Ptychodera flava TaxID=63121 RepID=UPI00396A7911